MTFMTDLSNDIRLAVDSGTTALGANDVSETIRSNSAKVIIVASKNKKNAVQDVFHLAKIANIKVLIFQGTSLELGAVCGKPYSVSMLSVIEPGNSNILNENY